VQPGDQGEPIVLLLAEHHRHALLARRELLIEPRVIRRTAS
jgi:hypothetical protein